MGSPRANGGTDHTHNEENIHYLDSNLSLTAFFTDKHIKTYNAYTYTVYIKCGFAINYDGGIYILDKNTCIWCSIADPDIFK